MRILRTSICVLILWFLILACSKVDLPKITVIGDSISMGYTPYLKRGLNGIARVDHVGENARDTDYGIENIERWLENDRSDIIIFNWGLWDLVYKLPASNGYGVKDKENGIQQTSIEKYESNLEIILERLTKKDAKLFFITTSYVPSNEPGMFSEDAINYNEVAVKVMKRYNVDVIDVYNKSKQIHILYGKGNNNVHFKKMGYKELGQFVSNELINRIFRK